MDRQAKRLEKKRKSREQAKKKAKAAEARRPAEADQYARLAAREPFGPCFVSATYDDLESPALVSVVVTRKLPDGRVLAATALVDRTCLGIKDGFSLPPMSPGALVDFVDQVGTPHGGMVLCEPLIAQSIVFHAIDYARSLGFEPHRDFPSAHFGPRPGALASTPWCSPENPIYLPGPRDDEQAIVQRLSDAVGANGFEQLDPFGLSADFDDDERGDDLPLVYSPLGCTISRDGMQLRVAIYRGETESSWLLELEDQLGGSTVWDDRFDTDQAALDVALEAIEQDGIESFTVPPESVAPRPM
ncbi:MAG TPA: hypothetical protein VFX59_07460 [Polyangiales bacterium]|nr:hypothetical protein [Polyangiales bacterium]